MKTKAILLSFLLLLNAVEIVRRPKHITYFHTTFMFTHIEVEVIEPEIRKDCAAFESMNLYIFFETYHLHHTLHWRYVKFIET